MSNNDGLYARLGDLEINFSVVNEKLGNTSEILGRMQDTMEQQTQLLSKVLVIQERQETFKVGLDKAQEGISEVVERVSNLEKVHTYANGWIKGIMAAVAALLVVLSFSVQQNVSRLDKMESDYYKPSTTITTSSSSTSVYPADKPTDSLVE